MEPPPVQPVWVQLMLLGLMLLCCLAPFIFAGFSMLVGCLAAKAGCGLSRLGRGDTDGARLTALRRAFDGVVVCAALRGVWLAATNEPAQHAGILVRIEHSLPLVLAPVLFFGLAGCVARCIVATELEAARKRWRDDGCHPAPLPEDDATGERLPFRETDSELGVEQCVNQSTERAVAFGGRM